MKVQDLMNKKLVIVPDRSTIRDVAIKMEEEDVASVLIIDKKGKLAGIVTDRDIAIAVAAESVNPKKTSISDIMTIDPVVVTPDNDIDLVLKIMNSNNIRRIPVCDNGKLVGMLSSSDIAMGLKDELNQFMGIEESSAKHS